MNWIKLREQITGKKPPIPAYRKGVRKTQLIGLIVFFILALITFLLMGCATVQSTQDASTFYEVTDRQIANKKGYLFRFKLNKYVNDSFIKELTIYSNASWEVTEIIHYIK